MDHLQSLRALAAKVARVHGGHNPRLIELDATISELTDTLETGADDAAETASLDQLFARVRAAADNFAVPDWACSSYRTLFRELEHLERDVLRHGE